MNESILAIDTASTQGVIGIFRSGECLASESFPDAHSQSELFFPMLARVLESAGLRLKDLAALAVAVGPGAFTALRIGIASAKAMADVASLPLIGVANTEAAASFAMRGRQGARTGLVLLPASRGDVFLAPFETGGEEDMVRMTGAAEVAKLAAWPSPEGGRGDLRFEVLVSPREDILATATQMPWAANAERLRIPDSLLGEIARQAWHRFQRGELQPPQTLDAAYVRRADADNSWVDQRA